ncbi:MAG: NHLP leader peptide family RiPP precursor [Bacillota bacterium]
MKPEKLREEIIKRALTDEEFKKRLLSDPKKTIEEEFNISTGDVDIKVLEETEDQFYIVIPCDNDDPVVGCPW